MSNSNMPNLTKLQMGLTSGCVSALLTQPLEVIKTSMIVAPQKEVLKDQKRVIRQFINSCRYVYGYKEAGVKNFFKGASIASVRQGLGFGIYVSLLHSNEKVIRRVLSDSSSNWTINSLNGVISKSMAVTVTVPLVLIKTRYELLVNNYNSIYQTVYQIYHQNHVTVQHTHTLNVSMTRKYDLNIFAKRNPFAVKIKNFYTGAYSFYCREVSYSFVQYALYKELRTMIGLEDKEKAKQIGFVLKYSPGFVSGFLANLISHPFEVVRNLQMGRNEYQNAINTAAQIYMEQGVIGFYNGIFPRLIRKPINSGITWGIYEFLRTTSSAKY